ncbi:MAG TPA: hypothetical protein VN742_04270, partial [Candidatus Binataceae bacterium]|nr:hypothetical protein [Candidatus Binataceae bacterium]
VKNEEAESADIVGGDGLRLRLKTRRPRRVMGMSEREELRGDDEERRQGHAQLAATSPPHPLSAS